METLLVVWRFLLLAVILIFPQLLGILLFFKLSRVPRWIAAIAAGGAHVLALKSDGTVLGWGANTDGQLGNGETAVTTPSPVQVTGLGAGSGILEKSF